MLFGLIYLKGGIANIDVLGPAEAWYRNWKRERAKRKFQVYMSKNNPDRDRTIH